VATDASIDKLANNLFSYNDVKPKNSVIFFCIRSEGPVFGIAEPMCRCFDWYKFFMAHHH